MLRRCAARGVIPPKKANSSAFGSVAAAFASPAGNKRGSAALARRAASTKSTPPFCAASGHFKAGRGKCSQADFQRRPSEAFYGKVRPKMVDRQRGRPAADQSPASGLPLWRTACASPNRMPPHSVGSARGLAGARKNGCAARADQAEPTFLRAVRAGHGLAARGESLPLAEARQDREPAGRNPRAACVPLRARGNVDIAPA